jgi:5-methylcytosine-specific restriction enzyme A
MKLTDDDGHELDAEYTVEPDGPYLAVVLSSRGGASGSATLRNPDYNQALTLLLKRLGRLNAVLADALVDSRDTQRLGLPDPERRIIEAPIRLALEPDADALRMRMGRAQSRIGQTGSARTGGNPTKRIRLRLEVPGYQPGDASRLARVLAGPGGDGPPMYILTWHPLHFRWPEYGYDEAIQVTAAGQPWPEAWTVGVRKGGIRPGDKAVIYRQYQERGVVASGVFTSGVETGEHWEQAGRQVRQAQVTWDIVLDYADRLPLEILKAEIPEVRWDRIQGSGIAVPAPAAGRLSELWARHASQVLFRSPDEPRGLDGQTFPEGALSRVPVNRYERDPRARKACLAHYGYRCAVCKFSFEERYGPLGRDYIHVHHTIELSRVPPGYQVNPITDLIPLCPNCHAMIHRGTGPALTVDELKQQLAP